MRYGEMDHGVVNEPWNDRVDGSGVALGLPDPQAASDRAPARLGLTRHGRRVDRPGISLRHFLGVPLVGQGADDGESERCRRKGAHRGVASAAANAIRIDEFVCADGFDARGRARHQTIDGMRVALSPESVTGIGSEGEARLSPIDLDPAGLGEFLLTENEMPENEESAGPALDVDMPRDRRFACRDLRSDGDRAAAQPVDPAAIAETHFEGGRNGEETPALARVDENAQAAAARDVVGIRSEEHT